MITITESAQEYLAELLAKQNVEGMSIRVFVSQAGTPQAETCIAYCRPGEEQEGDVPVEYKGFKAYFDKASEAFLKEAHVDYAKDKFGGQLTIKAPHAKVPTVRADSPLPDRVNYILFNEINPMLASHGGMVTLIQITEQNEAVLQFGGGCQGCHQVDVTLKEGVEKTLKERIPELTAVMDVTDHSKRENAYFK